MDGIVIEPDHANFTRVARALEEESDGDEWRRETAEELHEALRPGVAAVRGALLSMQTAGLGHAGEPLRQAVAAGVESIARFDGQRAGARIRAKRTPQIRGFANAPKRLNARRGWRHPVGGRDVWVTQQGRPGWFDDTLTRLHPRLRLAAERALENRARRISRRV